MKPGISSRRSTQGRLELGILGQHLHGCGEHPHRGLLAGGEEVRGQPHHVDDLGRGSVLVGRLRQPGEHVVAWRPAAFLDVCGEGLVEELEWSVGQRLAAGAAEASFRLACPAAEQVVVFLGHAEEVGDDQHGERAGEVTQELTPAISEELCELAVGEPPHRVLVLLQPARGQQAHEEGAVLRVPGRVEGRELVAVGQLVSMLLDQVGDVVAFEGHGKPGKRAGDRGARREALAVAVDGEGLVVPGDHEHAVVWLPCHRAPRPELVVVGVRVGDQFAAREEVRCVGVHCLPPRSYLNLILLGGSVQPYFTHRIGAVGSTPTSPDGQPLGERGIQTRRRILEAVGMAIEQRGLRGLRLADIADEVGFKPPAFYQYFADLDEAILALCEDVGDFLPEFEIDSDEWGAGHPLGTRPFVERFFDYWNQHRGLLTARHVAIMAGDERFQSAANDSFRPMAEKLHAKIEAGRARRAHRSRPRADRPRSGARRQLVMSTHQLVLLLSTAPRAIGSRTGSMRLALTRLDHVRASRPLGGTSRSLRSGTARRRP